MLIQSILYIFYIIHGSNISDSPIILMGVGALFETIILISLYFIYHNNPKKEIKEEKVTGDIKYHTVCYIRNLNSVIII